jgi:hypothetical protein
MHGNSLCLILVDVIQMCFDDCSSVFERQEVFVNAGRRRTVLTTANKDVIIEAVERAQC